MLSVKKQKAFSYDKEGSSLNPFFPISHPSPGPDRIPPGRSGSFLFVKFFALSVLAVLSPASPSHAQVWPNGCFTNGLTSWTSVVNAGVSATAGGVNGTGGNADCVGQVTQVTNGTVYPGQTAPGFAPNSNGMLPMVP